MADKPTEILSEKIVSDPAEYFNELIRDIGTARERVLLESYILEPDAMGKRVVDALVAAVRRGVRVRLLLDGVGCYQLQPQFLQQIRSEGVLVRLYHPLPFHFWHWKFGRKVRGSSLTRFFFFLTRVNRRNHRKVALIDRKIFWAGSFNITRRHLSLQDGGEGWHDLAVRVTGLDFSSAIYAFRRAWKLRPLLGRNPVHQQIRLNNTRFRRRKLARDLVRRIRTAGGRIWIANPYFVPNISFLSALKASARSGVEVRLLLPSRSDVPLYPLATRAFYRELLECGVKIFEFQNGILHSKVMVIDDFVIIGSSNLNSRSLHHDLEVDYVLGTKAAQAQATEHLEGDFRNAKLFGETDWSRLSIWRRWLSRAILILRYWI